jgi:hypothetical protein
MIGKYVEATSKLDPTLRIVGKVTNFMVGGYEVETATGNRYIAHYLFTIKEITK